MKATGSVAARSSRQRWRWRRSVAIWRWRSGPRSMASITRWSQRGTAGGRGDVSDLFGSGRACKGLQRRRDRQAPCQDRPIAGGTGFFSESLRSMSVARRRSMIALAHHRMISLLAPAAYL